MIFKNKKLKKCERKLLIILALATTYCYGDLEAKDKKMSTEPDKETLEFLVGFYEEFDGMDDEEFELLVSYAKKDAEDQPNNKPKDENGEQEESHDE